MRLTATNIEVKMYPPKPGHYIVSFVTPDLVALSTFVDGKMPERAAITIKDSNKRSLQANAYMWVLLDQIAAKHRTTAKEVYRKVIQDVGVWEWIMLTPDAVETFIEIWQGRGDGWVAIDYPKTTIMTSNGEKEVVPVKTIYGSSTYDPAQMCRLIDEVVEIAKADGIETMTPDQLEELKEKL